MEKLGQEKLEKLKSGTVEEFYLYEDSKDIVKRIVMIQISKYEINSPIYIDEIKEVPYQTTKKILDDLSIISYADQ